MSVKTPALRYHGGKFRLAPWIMQLFPPHQTYVEPYGGAAGVLLQKPRAYAEVYNDLDGDIFNFFSVLQDPARRAALTELLVMTPFHRLEFEQSYSPSDDSVERARRTVVRAQMGFGSGGATKNITGFRKDTQRAGSTVQQVWARYPNTIATLGLRLAGVLLENRPAIKVIREHDSPDTLFFVDPPYLADTRNSGRVYRYEMSDTDHAELLEALQSLTGMVVLSGYAHPLYDDTLTDWQRHDARALISGAAGSEHRTECVWLNPACTHATRQASLTLEGGGA